jgi:hypothetical protein
MIIEHSRKQIRKYKNRVEKTQFPGVPPSQQNSGQWHHVEKRTPHSYRNRDSNNKIYQQHALDEKEQAVYFEVLGRRNGVAAVTLPFWQHREF